MPTPNRDPLPALSDVHSAGAVYTPSPSPSPSPSPREQRAQALESALVERCRVDPILHGWVMQYLGGDCTLEYALLHAALALSWTVESKHRLLVDHLSLCSARPAIT